MTDQTQSERDKLRQLADGLFLTLQFRPAPGELAELGNGNARRGRALLEAVWREVEHDTVVPEDMYARQREAHDRGDEWTRDPRAHRPPPHDPTPLLRYSDDCWAARTFGRSEVVA